MTSADTLKDVRDLHFPAWGPRTCWLGREVCKTVSFSCEKAMQKLCRFGVLDVLFFHFPLIEMKVIASSLTSAVPKIWQIHRPCPVFRKFRRFAIWHIFVRSKELGPTTSRAWCRTCDVEEGKCHEEICDWSRSEPTSMLEQSLKDTVGTPYFMAPEASRWVSRSCFHLFINFQLRCWLLLAAGTLHDTWAHMHDIFSQLVFFYRQQVLPLFTSALILTGCEKQRLWLSFGHVVLGLLSDLALAHFKHY